MKNSDARSRVTGELQYGDDMRVEGMLHGRILWSAHPYARIRSIDTSAAEAMPGVVAVITAKDIPGKNQCGQVIRDQVAIASDLVKYIGDGVAAVFAESLEIANAALEKIVVDYEVLQGVFTPEEAARPDAPRLHEKGNLLHEVSIVRGDMEDAFRKCAVVVEDNYTTPAIEHGFMEPESGLAFPTEDGGVEIRIGSQCVFDDRTQLSEILALPEEKIRVRENPDRRCFRRQRGYDPAAIPGTGCLEDKTSRQDGPHPRGIPAGAPETPSGLDVLQNWRR